MPFIVLLVLVAPAVLAGPAAPARAGTARPRAFRVRVEAAAATDAGLLAITSRGVEVLDPTGNLRTTRWPVRETARTSQPLPTTPTRSAWPGLTADADFTGAAYDADDIDDGDDPRLADDGSERAWDIDEGTSGARATGALLVPPPLPPLLAAAGDSGWVLRTDGVWKIGLRDGAAARVYACDGRRVRALAASAGPDNVVTVALVNGDQLLRAKEGQAFERVGGSVPRARGLVIAGTGTLVVLDAAGALWAYGGRTDDGTILFHEGVDDIARCSGDVLVLRDDQLFAFGDPGTRHLGPAPPGTERLACGAESGGWAAFGTRMHVSADQGRTWTLRPSPGIRPVLALLPVRAALWLVVRPGLWPLPPVAQAAEPRAPTGSPTSGVALAGREGAADARRPSDFWRRWASLLPEVDVEFEIGRVGPVREVRGLVAASFRLDGLWSGLVPRRRARREWEVGPDVGSTAALDGLAVDASDPFAAAERRALARILEEPP